MLAGFLVYRYVFQPAQKNTDASPSKVANESTKPNPEKVSNETYSGERVTVANQFSIKVPDGWQASISEVSGFKAIMFARPEQLSSLVYEANKPANISRDGIASWSGLTEHFFVLAADTPQKFNPAEHQEITSEAFTFDDATVGLKYTVIKHANEATRWGGLLRDSEWQGRTYIYTKDGKQIEAHLALYPSAKLDIAFFESVARSINTNASQ